MKRVYLRVTELYIPVNDDVRPSVAAIAFEHFVNKTPFLIDDKRTMARVHCELPDFVEVVEDKPPHEIEEMERNDIACDAVGIMVKELDKANFPRYNSAFTSWMVYAILKATREWLKGRGMDLRLTRKVKQNEQPPSDNSGR